MYSSVHTGSDFLNALPRAPPSNRPKLLICPLEPIAEIGAFQLEEGPKQARFQPWLCSNHCEQQQVKFHRR